jgi:hypothetical protein
MDEDQIVFIIIKTNKEKRQNHSSDGQKQVKSNTKRRTSIFPNFSKYTERVREIDLYEGFEKLYCFPQPLQKLRQQ